MVHLDLFSGIGGFAYAIDQVWDNVEHIFCDNDLFCRQVLKKHWPRSYIYEDIRAITDTRSEKQRGVSNVKRQEVSSAWKSSVDLLTGGFPCQPFSAAGSRRGTSDDRYLWPEMLRVIQLTKPKWVIAENVRGLLTLQGGVVFEQVCSDLEAEGYEVQPFIIPALAVNAPHRRDRIWFVAHSLNDRQRGEKRKGDGASDSLPKEYRSQDSPTRKSERTTGNRQDDRHATNPEHQRQAQLQSKPRRKERIFESNTKWSKDWHEVATQLCGVDDGLPARLDGFELTKPQHRTQRLKALGNAIVPQVAIQIFQAIKQLTINEKGGK